MTETNRCASASRRVQDASVDEAACTPTPEQTEAKAQACRQDTDRAAEERRDAYIASGTDEGGRSARASSDASRIDPWLHDDPQAKAAARTRRIDPPLQDDVLGNALVGVVAGGAGGGIRAAAGKVGMRGAGATIVQATPASTTIRAFGSAGTKEIAASLSAEATGGAAFARGAAMGMAKTAAGKARDEAVARGASAAADALQIGKSRTADSTPPPPSSDAPAGQSTRRGTSAPATEPNTSTAPRIPEALPEQVRIRG
jgi:hypothetical protein